MHKALPKILFMYLPGYFWHEVLWPRTTEFVQLIKCVAVYKKNSKHHLHFMLEVRRNFAKLNCTLIFTGNVKL